MAVLSGFGSFADVDEDVVSDTISRRVISGERGMIVWWHMKPDAHLPAERLTQERIIWVLRGVIEFRLDDQREMCVPGDVIVVPPGTEHEAWFAGEAEIVDVLSPPRGDYLTGA